MEKEIKKNLGRWKEYKNQPVVSFMKHYIRFFSADEILISKYLKIKIDTDKKTLVFDRSDNIQDWKVDKDNKINNVVIPGIPLGVYPYETTDTGIIIHY